MVPEVAIRTKFQEEQHDLPVAFLDCGVQGIRTPEAQPRNLWGVDITEVMGVEEVFRLPPGRSLGAQEPRILTIYFCV